MTVCGSIPNLFVFSVFFFYVKPSDLRNGAVRDNSAVQEWELVRWGIDA